MQLGRLSLVPFFAEAKKGTSCRATPGYSNLIGSSSPLKKFKALFIVECDWKS